MLIAYLPKEKVLLEADGYNPQAATATPPNPPSPYTVEPARQHSAPEARRAAHRARALSGRQPGGDDGGAHALGRSDRFGELRDWIRGAGLIQASPDWYDHCTWKSHEIAPAGIAIIAIAVLGLWWSAGQPAGAQTPAKQPEQTARQRCTALQGAVIPAGAIGLPTSGGVVVSASFVTADRCGKQERRVLQGSRVHPSGGPARSRHQVSTESSDQLEQPLAADGRRRLRRIRRDRPWRREQPGCGRRRRR